MTDLREEMYQVMRKNKHDLPSWVEEKVKEARCSELEMAIRRNNGLGANPWMANYLKSRLNTLTTKERKSE